MKEQVRRLFAKLIVLAVLLAGIYLAAAPPDGAKAAPEDRAPCNCYNELHERMGVLRPSGLCDPVC